MILLDTSILVDSLTGPQRSAPMVRQAAERGERFAVTALVLYEWRRGPRRADELAAQEALFPVDGVLAFGAVEAVIAAEIYQAIARPRGREVDIAIAAAAIARDAHLWTLNNRDFADIPGLKLWKAPHSDA